MIHYQCSTCHTPHTSSELMAGMAVICKQCKQAIVVPKASTSEPTTTDTPKDVKRAIASPAPAKILADESTAPPRSANRSRIWFVLSVGVLFSILSWLAWNYLRVPATPGLHRHDAAVWCVAWSPDGRHVVSGGADSLLILWNADTGREIVRFEGHADTVTCVAFSKDGRHILSGSFDKTVRLWDAANGKLLEAYAGHEWVVTSVAFSADGALAASASADQTVRIWDIHQGKEHLRIQGHKLRPGDKTLEPNLQATGRFPREFTEIVTSVRFMPDDRSLLTASTNGFLTLWALKKGTKQLDLGPVRAFALCADVSRDGKYLLAGGGAHDRSKPGDFDLYLLEASNPAKRRTFAGHTDCITSVAFSPDGQRALTGSRDQTVRVWDVSSARELHRFEGHGDIVTSVAFAPNGRRAVSASFDKTVRLWQLPE